MHGLGVDLNGVIRSRKDGSASLDRPEIPGAIAAIRQLADVFGDRVFVLSKSRPHKSGSRQDWLHRHDFFGRTGIEESRVIYCSERSDKAVLAARLGLTHFVDDRLEVLAQMSEVPSRFLFQPRSQEVAGYSQHLAGVTQVVCWDRLSWLIRQSAALVAV